MAIKQVDEAVNGKRKKAAETVLEVDTPAAPSTPDKSDTSPALDAAETVLAKMHEQPHPYVTRCTYRMTTTIPTGNYENIVPQVEVEYLVPEGAIAPDNVDVLDGLRRDIAMMMLPRVEEQTNMVQIVSILKDMSKSEEQKKNEVAAAFVAGSALFRWLSTFDRNSARLVLTRRLNMYKDA